MSEANKNNVKTKNNSADSGDTASSSSSYSSSTSSSNSDSLENLVTGIKNSLTESLSEMMSKLLDTAQINLFDRSNEADSNEDQTRYFELMNQLRVLKAEIAVDFISNIKVNLAPEVDAENLKSQDNTDIAELSLVDQDEMEAIVLVNGVGERSAAKYQEQLSQLDARLQHLSIKTKTFKTEAIQPTSFCQAFDDALSNNFDTTDKRMLFSMFDAGIASNLDDIYDSINNSLIDAGILPQIKRGIEIKPTSDRTDSLAANQTDESAQNTSTESPAPASQNGSNSDNDAGNNISGFAMTAPPGANYNQVAQNTSITENNPNTAAASSSNHAGENSGTHAGSYYDQRPASGSGEYLHQTAGIPASQVGKVLGNYLGTPFTPDTVDNSAKNSANNAAIYPPSTGQHFGHEDILRALSSIQNLPEFVSPEKTHFDGDAVKRAIMSSIAKTSGGAVTKSINQIAEKTINFIELIFDAIIEDRGISDTIKTLLLRLQIPIIKASMSDQEFFIYDNHPARELLDTIADVGVGLTDHDDKTYIHLDNVISDILGEYELSTETFKEALDGLKAYIEEKEAVTREKESEEQKLLLRKHARATILKSLRAATTGKILPESTHPLILKRWPTLMFNHYLANGKENDEWINIVLTLRRIVDSVQPLDSADKLEKIIREKDTLFTLTEKYLNISSNSKKDVQSIMQVFKETIQLHIDDANFTDEEVNTAAEVADSSEPVNDIPLDNEDQDKPEIPLNIMPGMWFQIYMGEDNVHRRCKLSVILIEDAKLMFVNHKGELVAEKTFDEFNEEVANDMTMLIMGHSAFENAFKTVIRRLD